MTNTAKAGLSRLTQPILPFWFPTFIALVSALLLLLMPQFKLAAVHSSFYDLGQYATNFTAISLDAKGGWALRGHAHLFADLYAIAYAIYASPVTLLALQSFILVTSALLAGRLFAAFDAGRPVEGAVIYLLSIPVWFSALFDFHYEHLIFPILFAGMLATRGDGWSARLTALGAGLLLCLVKEPYPLMAIGFGLYLILARRWFVEGAVLIILAAGYFLTVTGTIIPYFSGGQLSGELWSSAFGYLGDSISAMLGTMIANPILPISAMLTPHKLLYVFGLGGAVGFVFLRAPAATLPALPILAISLISENPSHSYLGNQYAVGVAAPLFVATAIALGKTSPATRLWAKRLVFLTSFVFLMLFGPAPISRLFIQNATFTYGASAYLPSERDGWINDTIAKTVPADLDTVVATQNVVLTPRLATRFDLVAFPTGVFEPFTTLKDRTGSVLASFFVALADTGGSAALDQRFADWVVLDRKRPLYLNDKGCGWLYGACTDPTQQARFATEAARLPEAFEQVFSEDGLEIYRRRN